MLPLSVGSGRLRLKNPNLHSNNVKSINNNSPANIARMIIHIGIDSCCSNKSTLAVVSTCQNHMKYLECNFKTLNKYKYLNKFI